VRVTHPFHPLAGQEFDLLMRRRTWAEDRVLVVDGNGVVVGFPAGWTDVVGLDPFVAVAAGRSALRVEDLLALARIIDDLRAPGRLPGVNPTTPKCKANDAATVTGARAWRSGFEAESQVDGVLTLSVRDIV
jgi:hypothetical protein